MVESFTEIRNTEGGICFGWVWREKVDSIQGCTEWSYHWDVQVKMSKKQLDKWFTAQDRKTGPRYLSVSHQHRVGHERGWDHLGRILRVKNRADLAQNTQELQGMILGREACKGGWAVAKQSKNIESWKPRDRVFQEKGNQQKSQTLRKSTGSDHRRWTVIELGS